MYTCAESVFWRDRICERERVEAIYLTIGRCNGDGYAELRAKLANLRPGAT